MHRIVEDHPSVVFDLRVTSCVIIDYVTGARGSRYPDTRNYNYGQCGKVIGSNLLNNPDLVATDPMISFKTAFWFWMTPQSPKPSCHDVITGRWNPSGTDKPASSNSGYGTITNIINGGLECGKGSDGIVADRIGFFKRYCDLLGVGYGDNLDCYNQKPFGSGLATY